MSDRLTPKLRNRIIANRLFDGVRRDVIDVLLSTSILRRFPSGDRVFSSGGQSDCLLLLLSGTVTLTVSGTIIASRGPDEWIGEQGVLDSAGRSAEAIAQTETTVLVVPSQSFLVACSTSSTLSLNLARLISSKLRESSLGRGEFYSRELRLLAAVRNRVSDEAFNTIFTDYMETDVKRAPDFVPVAPRKEDAVVMVTDIRSFTSITEQLDLAGIQTFLRRYFTDIVEILERNSLYIDKFIGDGVLAYSLPRITPDSHERAVRAAIELTGLPGDYLHSPPMRTRTGVGIHCGEVLVGDFGAASHFEYTIIGDPVNVASRLQDKTKDDRTSVIVSSEVHGHLSPSTKLLFSSKPMEATLRNRDATIQYHTKKDNSENTS